MDSDIAEDPKSDVLADEGADEDELLAEDSEMQTEDAEGDEVTEGPNDDGEDMQDATAESGTVGEDGNPAQTDISKTEEELEIELKETQITIPRYAPHTIPEWQLEAMRTRWQWHIRMYPIDQEDCRNCILDTATKISQEAWYYVPKRKNGQGLAELCMNSTSEAKSVMGRVVRMPFYHRFVTIEINKRKKDDREAEEGGEDSTSGSYVEVEESGGLKRRTLWVRYLSEDTTPELLRVVFPFAQTTQVQTHDSLRIGEVRTNSKTDVLLFMKSYLTLSLDGTHILGLQNTEPTDKENDFKADLEKSVTPLFALEEAPTTVADRSDQRKEDRNFSSRLMKRSLQPQLRQVESKRKEPLMRGRAGEPPAKRGARGNWGDRFEGRRSGGGSGGGRFGGFPSGPGGMGYGSGPPPRGYGGALLDPQGMAAEMIMMQAQLNQTIQNQLRMLNPSSGGGGGGYGGGRMGGGGGGGGRNEGRRGGWGSGGRSGGRGGGRKGYGGSGGGGGGGW